MATEKHFSLVGIALMLVLLQTVVAKSLKEDKLYGQNNIGKLRYKLKDCRDLWNTGYKKPDTYSIYLDGFNETKIFCNNTENAYAKTMVIQRRLYGTENFYRTYNDYVVGFGNPQGDYWAGLNVINYYTSKAGYNKLRIDLQDWAGNKRYITYNHFVVTDASDYYRMYIGGPYGTLVDDMSFSNGMYFYTYDRPDQNLCAAHQKAGWWYNNCSYVLLNGFYYHGGKYVPSGGYYDGIYWKDWGDYDYSMKFVSMTIYQ